MADTKNITLTATFVAYASGAGNVSFQPLDHDCEWAIFESTTPTAGVGGKLVRRGVTESMELLSGEYLHLRGRGVCAITPDIEV